MTASGQPGPPAALFQGWIGKHNSQLTIHGRRNVCFIRDPNLNVLELNEILNANI